MIPGGWAPETWGDFTAAGLVVFMGVVFYWSLVTERIVIGRYHRDTIERLDRRAEKDATSIETLSRALSEKNAADDATAHILAAFREAVAKGGER